MNSSELGKKNVLLKCADEKILLLMGVLSPVLDSGCDIPECKKIIICMYGNYLSTLPEDDFKKDTTQKYIDIIIPLLDNLENYKEKSGLN